MLIHLFSCGEITLKEEDVCDVGERRGGIVLIARLFEVGFRLAIELRSTIQFAFVGVSDRHIIQNRTRLGVFSKPIEHGESAFVGGNRFFIMAFCAAAISDEPDGVGCARPIAFGKEKIVCVFADRNGALRLIAVQDAHTFVSSGQGVDRDIGLSRRFPDRVAYQQQ